jgi:redox-sensitive bicupin YhaK (pirin superfamily)/CBS domain-containing protein
MQQTGRLFALDRHPRHVSCDFPTDTRGIVKASDIMSSPVISVPPDAPVREAAALLSERRISGLPVLEGERLVGLVSEADLLRPRPLGRAPAKSVREIMTHDVVTIPPDAPLRDIAVLLEERGIKRVPVLQAGRVVGIVSRSNLVQALAVKALPQTPHAQQDEAIRSRLLSRLEDEPGWSRAESNVVVDDGVVYFWGRRGSEEERQSTLKTAKRIAGVRGIEDHRALPGPPREAAGKPQVRRASERGHANYGWENSYYSFSFGNFYDPAYTGYGALHAINEKAVEACKGSTTYGLSDMEVVTYMLQGALEHEDSLSNCVTLSDDSVQCLSAGSGVRFSESNPGPSESSRFLQLWLRPDVTGLPAAYAHKNFPEATKRGRLQVIASPDGRDGSLRLRVGAVLYAALFDNGERAQLDVLPPRLAYVHLARGVLRVQGEELHAGDGLATGGAIVFEGGRGAEVLVLDLPEGPATGLVG